MWQDFFLGKTDYWKLLGWSEKVKLVEMKNKPLKFNWIELYSLERKSLNLKVTWINYTECSVKINNVAN